MEKVFLNEQKQPPIGVLKKKCSENRSKFTGERPGRRAISIKSQSKFIEITLWHGCFHVKLLYFQNTFSYEHLWMAASV